MPKVKFMENEKLIEKEFETEAEAKVFKLELKKKGIKGKWEW